MIRITLLVFSIALSGCCGMGSLVAGDKYTEEDERATCLGWRNAQYPNGTYGIDPSRPDDPREWPSEVQGGVRKSATGGAKDDSASSVYGFEASGSPVAQFQ